MELFNLIQTISDLDFIANKPGPTFFRNLRVRLAVYKAKRKAAAFVPKDIITAKDIVDIATFKYVLKNRFEGIPNTVGLSTLMLYPSADFANGHIAGLKVECKTDENHTINISAKVYSNPAEAYIDCKFEMENPSEYNKSKILSSSFTKRLESLSSEPIKEEGQEALFINASYWMVSEVLTSHIEAIFDAIKDYYLK